MLGGCSLGRSMGAPLAVTTWLVCRVPWAPLQSVYFPYSVQFFAPTPLSSNDDVYSGSAPGFLLFTDNQGQQVRGCAPLFKFPPPSPCASAQ